MTSTKHTVKIESMLEKHGFKQFHTVVTAQLALCLLLQEEKKRLWFRAPKKGELGVV